MVMLVESAKERIYELSDDRGRFIGRIVDPTCNLIVGPHAGTVFLVRDAPRIRPVFRTPSLFSQER